MMVTFEEKYPYIVEQIQKRRNKWNLDGIAWMDFDDVVQIITTHIHKKWDMWDQSRPLAPWLNKVISSQLKNIIRNNYKGPSKGLTNKQKTRQRQKMNVNMPLSWEFHYYEISEMAADGIDLEGVVEDVRKEMRGEVEPKYYQAFLMLFFFDSSEEDVAEFLGYRSSEPNRKAGYKQIRNLKNMFKDKVLQILKRKDLLYM